MILYIYKDNINTKNGTKSPGYSDLDKHAGGQPGATLGLKLFKPRARME